MNLLKRSRLMLCRTMVRFLVGGTLKLVILILRLLNRLNIGLIVLRLIRLICGIGLIRYIVRPFLVVRRLAMQSLLCRRVDRLKFRVWLAVGLSCRLRNCLNVYGRFKVLLHVLIIRRLVTLALPPLCVLRFLGLRCLESVTVRLRIYRLILICLLMNSARCRLRNRNRVILLIINHARRRAILIARRENPVICMNNC